MNPALVEVVFEYFCHVNSGPRRPLDFYCQMLI